MKLFIKIERKLLDPGPPSRGAVTKIDLGLYGTCLQYYCWGAGRRRLRSL